MSETLTTDFEQLKLMCVAWCAGCVVLVIATLMTYGSEEE
jgi:hypothetical protein